MTVEDILAALRTIVDEAEGRSLTDDEVQRYEELEEKLEKAKKDVEIRSRQQAYETPVRNDIGVRVATPAEDDTLERAFDHYLRTGKANQDIAELRAQSVGTDSAGGYTVPETFRQRLTERTLAFGGLATAVETITTTSGEPMRWPTLDDTSNTGQTVAENTAPTTGSDLTFGEKTLGAHKYVAPGANGDPLRVSVELLQDSAFDIQGLVQRKLGERIARQQAAHWVNGAGTTEPFGITTSSGTSVTFAAAEPTYEELLDALHSVDPSYRDSPSVAWSFNDSTLRLIRGITDGNGRPLLQSTTEGVEGDPGGMRLLGKPVVIDQAFADYSDVSGNTWGAFGDLRAGYVIRRVQDVTLIVNPYTRANEGQVEYTLWARADGVPQDDFAFSLLANDTAA